MRRRKEKSGKDFSNQLEIRQRSATVSAGPVAAREWCMPVGEFQQLVVLVAVRKRLRLMLCTQSRSAKIYRRDYGIQPSVAETESRLRWVANRKWNLP